MRVVVRWLLSAVLFFRGVTCAPSTDNRNVRHADTSAFHEPTVRAPFVLDEPPLVLDGKTASDDGLLAWAATRHDTTTAPSTSINRQPPPPRTCLDCFLVVGIKTRVVHGFRNRQLIRTTWADAATVRSLRTRVVFLACKPDLSNETNESNANATLHALAREKELFGGDLLTHELGGCVDSYFRLVDKVLGFFAWTTTHHASASYVMVGDDDVYMRLDRIVAMLQAPTTPPTRYYAGQVTYAEFGRFVHAIRDPLHKHYLPVTEYPLSNHVPRAIGPHYLLSSDLMWFVARNRRDLRGVGTIEDLTVAFWLRSLLRVDPVYVPVFASVLTSQCHSALVSYGDLSLHAMRQIHANLVRGDGFCHGFSSSEWANPSAKVPSQAHAYAKAHPYPDVVYDWDIQLDVATRSLEVRVTVQLPLVPLTLPQLAVTPAVATFDTLCLKLHATAAQLDERLPILLCEDLFYRLDEYLHDTQRSRSAAAFALMRSNLPPLPTPSLTVNVWISNRTARWRWFFESLLGVIYPDIHIFVVTESQSTAPIDVFVPDFVVVDASDLPSLPTLPPFCRLVVINTSLTPSVVRRHVRAVIWFTPTRSYGDHASSEHHVVVVPLASLVFSDSLVHSPLELLSASNDRRPSVSRPERVVVPHCNQRAAALLALLPDDQTFECTHATVTKEDATVVGSSSPDTLFAFDAAVARYAQATFVLAFETRQTTPGDMAGTIVAAFVAGSVPVYDGDDASVARLFNPKAFISCGRVATLRDCRDIVVDVARSPERYAAMRREPPVVNTTAFFEAFSWHPDVLTKLQEASAVGDAHGADGMAERLRTIIYRT